MFEFALLKCVCVCKWVYVWVGVCVLCVGVWGVCEVCVCEREREREWERLIFLERERERMFVKVKRYNYAPLFLSDGTTNRSTWRVCTSKLRHQLHFPKTRKVILFLILFSHLKGSLKKQLFIRSKWIVIFF